MAKKEAKFQESNTRLLRTEQGEAVYTLVGNVRRYVMENGVIDLRSTVDPRVTAVVEGYVYEYDPPLVFRFEEAEPLQRPRHIGEAALMA